MGFLVLLASPRGFFPAQGDSKTLTVVLSSPLGTPVPGATVSIPAMSGKSSVKLGEGLKLAEKGSSGEYRGELPGNMSPGVYRYDGC